MTKRDWWAEWNALIERHNEAFERWQELQAPVVRTFAASGAPEVNVLDAADAAHQKWRDAQAALDRFLEEARRSED